jgi:pSer/pThr/pTyr-binding forkhead associated (FHA) protein
MDITSHAEVIVETVARRDQMTDNTDPTIGVTSQSLLVISGNARGAVIPIPLDDLLLGREAGQPGQLEGDPQLSRRHARITSSERGQVLLEDLGSTNGTFLNGGRITSRQPIHPGDIIAVGGSKLQVLEATAARDAETVTRPGLADDEPLSTAWGTVGVDSTEAPEALLIPPSGPPPGGSARRNQSETEAGGRRGDRSDPHVPRRGRAIVQGQVRGIQQRTEGESTAVWSFRIERYDPDGNRLPPIPAQMRAVAFEGSLNEGDEVSVIGEWQAGTLHAKRVENLTTRATVKAKSYKKAAAVVLVVLAIMVAGFATVAVFSNRQFNQTVERSRQEQQQRADQMHQEFCQQAEQASGRTPPGC